MLVVLLIASSTPPIDSSAIPPCPFATLKITEKLGGLERKYRQGRPPQAFIGFYKLKRRHSESFSGQKRRWRKAAYVATPL